MGRVHFEDQFGEPQIVVLSAATILAAADPGAVVRAVSDQDPTQQLGAEAVAPLVDEREANPRCCVVNQWLRRLAQDLVLTA